MLSLDLIRECGLPGPAKGPVLWQGDRTRPKWRWILILSTSHLSGELALLIVCINLHLLRDDCASNCPLSCTIKTPFLYISLFTVDVLPLKGNTHNPKHLLSIHLCRQVFKKTTECKRCKWIIRPSIRYLHLLILFGVECSWNYPSMH